MHFTRPRELVVAGLIGLVLGFALVELFYGELPRFPLLAGLPLLIVAAVEVILGFTLRSRIRAGRVLDPIAVARAVALAKASSLLGSFMTGAWLGVLAYLVPRGGDVAAAADDLPGAGIGAVCAAVLAGAALWLEHCCRAPDSRDSDHPGRPTG
ncbi:DUF3180 domain-containing protein [Amycolatopsis albispora]|uniref:DUF3180 domain-containing protein n=1 Tax=Amycolatopsis albispora TaxID=1804986 RepID=A0A344LC78_9PSEU|nr:DUF3180 domain-containing protein [Amycolatopsis albispora]AXB45652.1 hypothetical protein A4R43_26790 [Amycolatopsis albispora]